MSWRRQDYANTPLYRVLSGISEQFSKQNMPLIVTEVIIGLPVVHHSWRVYADIVKNFLFKES